jgi:hypothetical protein
LTVTVVIAESWPVFEQYCAKHDIDHSDRKVVIPLVTFSDKYRLWGRKMSIRRARVMRVGNVEPGLLKAFKHELTKEGWEGSQ